ncbi:MAG: hypothetical protein M1833_001692 [Piccolia ochrophora]|nr:MAG: hypothetical protein M1833_001692 [Piccolia ochrophora]
MGPKRARGSVPPVPSLVLSNNLAERNIGWPIPTHTRRTSLWDFQTRHLTPQPANVRKVREQDVEWGETKTTSFRGPGTGPGLDKERNIVGWEGPHDLDNPKNWSRLRKWLVTVFLSLMAVTVSFASGVFGSAVAPTAKMFETNTEVMTLGTSLFILGYAISSLLFIPISEVHGRRIPLFLGFSIFAIFQIPVAVAKNISTILVCRFLGGVCGFAPLVLVGGIFSDLWDPVDRVSPICFFVAVVFSALVGAPVIGELCTSSHLGWRWTTWLPAMVGLFLSIVGLFVVHETYPPVILRSKANKIRRASKNWAFHAEVEEEEPNMLSVFYTHSVKPLALLISSPILLFTTIHISLTSGILYLSLTRWNTTFASVRGFTPISAALPFLSIITGIILGGLFTWLFTSSCNARTALRPPSSTTTSPPPAPTIADDPEDNLLPMTIGGLALPASLFIFAWTSNPNITWIPQVLAGVPFGFGVFCVITQGTSPSALPFVAHPH